VQVQLSDPGLGTLDLGTYPYVVTQLQIGSPTVRTVMRHRALADGAFDDTRYLGSRAVTVTCRLNNRGRIPGCSGAIDMQTLLDFVLPYMSPRLRPTLSYQLPGSPTSRSMVVRGESWPVGIDGPKYPTLPLQFVCPSGEIFSGDEGDVDCVTITPATEVEAGRTYDLTFDRQYPAAQPLGGRLVQVEGSTSAHWNAKLYGAVTDPTLAVNGVRIQFTGVVVAVGDYLEIDTRTRTILLNGDPSASRYAQTNFTEWNWDQLRLHPGENTIFFGGTNLSATASALVCWRPTWLG